MKPQSIYYLRLLVPDTSKRWSRLTLNQESYSMYEPNVYDDRDEQEPEFTVDEEFAYSIGYSDPDPAI